MVSADSVIEQSKDRYYRALRETQSTIRTGEPDWQPWTDFILRALQQQKERLRIKVELERNHIMQLPALSVQILEHIKGHGRASVADLTAVTARSRNTLKVHLRRLVESKHLARHGAGRGTYYALT